MGYENLLIEAEHQGLRIYEKRFKSNAKGLCKGNKIGISRLISTNAEKKCILAEELGHHKTSVGNIIDQSNVSNRKQELRARGWAYQRLIPLSRIIEAGQVGLSDRYNIAEWLEVTEEFLQASLDYYERKFGIHTSCDGYKINFNPLNISRLNE